jgi:tRNA1Val (adenine37-N6)-methyltransferase
MDSLLLACFAPTRERGPVVDLGAGCGVVGLGWALRVLDTGREPHGLFLEMSADMAGHCRANVRALGLDRGFRVVETEAAQVRQLSGAAAESASLVLCNPPYRSPGSGRTPADPGRRAAGFEEAGGLGDFAQAAAYLLANRARACFVYPAQRLADLLAGLGGARLAPKRMRFVHPRPGRDAGQVLVEAVKNGRPGLTVEEPLLLYGPGKGRDLAPEALEFCPYLNANPGPGRDRETPDTGIC